MVFITSAVRFIHTHLLRRAPTTPEGNPLPRTLHAVLGEPATRYRRVIVVGDVHGCVAELRLLLDRLYYRSGVDLLVCVGDLVNKGPDSPGVLRLAAEAQAVSVRGNHDDQALAAFYDARAGRALKKARYDWVRGIDGAAAGVMREMPFSLLLAAYNVAVVHAGVLPGTRLEEQRLQDLITVSPRSSSTRSGACLGRRPRRSPPAVHRLWWLPI
jgi:predicted phosphodiesterase